MKRFFVLTIGMCMIILAGCSSGSETATKAANAPTGVSDVIEAQIEKAEGGQTDAEGAVEETQATETTAPETAASESQSPDTDTETETVESVDLKNEPVKTDLTTLSSTMVYSEVNDMMIYPENHMGDIVKMRGEFAVYTDEETNKNYYACIIKDATACCSQGIEFELYGDHTYPEDYPEEGSEITVIGSFDTYEEGVYRFCTLRNAYFEES